MTKAERTLEEKEASVSRGRIWITWETHRRTRELASSIPGLALFEFDLDGPRAVRYPVLLLKTALTLLRQRPHLAIVQNPSMVLALLMTGVGKTFGFRVVVDAHNEGVRPFSSKLRWLLPLYSLVQKWAHRTIVTNEALARMVRANRGRPIVLPDRLPRLGQVELKELKGQYRFVFICTFAKDEPYRKVIEAARSLDKEVVIYITGRYDRAGLSQEQMPGNVVLTGFLPEQEYISLLYSSNCVIDLTLMEDCLVCGAYEAVALGKPMILSNTNALREYFRAGAVYTDNTVKGIADAIRIVIEEEIRLNEEVKALSGILKEEWTQQHSGLLRALD